MSLVIGVDFGTLSVRATVLDTALAHGKGVLGTGVASYPLKRSASDPDLATQSHADHMRGLVEAVRRAVDTAGIRGQDISAIACDTTGSSVLMVDRQMRPLGDYYLWCDHRAHREAAEITARGREEGLEALDWCGGVYSHEWGYAKLLHFLRHNPDARGQLGTALEHCDMVAATLCGIDDPRDLRRSVCAMGHKWLWGAAWGGLPDQGFLSRVDPLFDGINDKLAGPVLPSDQLAGHLSAHWAHELGLRPGIPVPIGAFDAHWDALGAGCRLGDAVNVVGTSTCIIGLGRSDLGVIQGLCGLVPGSVRPDLMGIEAGLSATGDIFDAIARRAGQDVATLAQGLEQVQPGQTGLMRLSWDNGDRTVLVRSDLSGITLGWDLNHTAADELHAAIEGTAHHTRIILERMADGGVPITRIINGGGIPQRSPLLNQIYADVIARPVLVPDGVPQGLGSCIVASLAAGSFASIEAAQDHLCLPMREVLPRPAQSARYQEMHALYRDLYFGFGEGRPFDMGGVLARLKAWRRG